MAKKTAVKSGGKSSSRDKKKKKSAVQEEGKLMLNNPLIPPELDEDIDDDLAFDSEDERLYGSFFAKDSGSRKEGKPKSKKKSKKKGGDNEEEDDDFFNYHEDGQSTDEDGDEYLNLEDMLDMSTQKEEKKSARNRPTVESETGVKVTKKKRSGKDLPASEESLFPDHEHHATFHSTLKKIMKTSEEGGKTSAAAARLAQAMENTHNLIGVDVDEKTKDATTRKKVREITEENLKKYKPLLRELNNSKHVQLPMPAPESNPIPSSLGAIAATSIGRLVETGQAAQQIAPTSNRTVAQKLATKMSSLLSSAGLSRANANEEVEAASAGINPFRTSSSSTAEGSGVGPSEAEPPTIQYMSKLKAMLATENSRRKRLNKIKSKTYRRILRKEKERDKEKREKALELLNPELARKRLAEKLLKARAEERVTQKHKNTSAWVKHAKKFAQFDTQAKDAINEQLSIHQQLMQKMEEEAGEDNYNRYVGDDEGEDSEADEQLVDELLATSDTEGVKKVASNLWNSIESSGVSGSTPAITKARQELREMKFMKAAKERELKNYSDELNALKVDIQRVQNGEEEEAATAEQSKVGRMRFSSEKTETIALQNDRDAARRRASVTRQADTANGAEEVEEDAGEFAGNRKSKKNTTSARVTLLPGGATVGSKRKAEDEAGDLFAADDDDAEDSSAMVGGASTISSSHTSGSSSARKGKKIAFDDAGNQDLMSDNQAYLVSRAFANDDVDEDFSREKDSQVEMMMKPEDRNQNLPGWGEWGGEDERLNKRHQEKLAHSTMQKNIQKTFLKKSRADAALDHVIINHDGVELVPDRMTLHMVPRPFSNPQEFARSMRQPVGPEWTSPLSFVEGVQPRVEVRQGHAVVPLDLSLRSEKAKTKRRKVEVNS